MFSRYKYVEGMLPIIDSNNNYFINYLGQVKDHLGNDLKTSLDSDNYITVNLTSWDGKRNYRICDLMVIHFKYMTIPKSDFNKIIGFHIDECLDNLSAKNIGYRFFGGKLESSIFPGYYYIPSYARVLINKHGNAISYKSGNTLLWSVTAPGVKKSIGGYKYLSAKACNGKEVTLLRHRALALVFMDYLNNCDSLVVNHKDGVPGNDYLDNLEWVTRRDNNIHAFENNLRNQNKEVLSRNVLTGEIKEYYSISECARILGYPSDETIRQRLLRHGPDKTHQDGYQIKYKSDSREWYISINPQRDILEAEQAIKVKVKDCISKKIYNYDSVMLASKYTGVNKSTIIYRLNKDDTSPLRGFQFMYSDDTRSFPSFTNDDYIDTLHGSAISVDVKNHLTGEVKSFNSISKTIKYIGRDISEILRNKKQTLLDNGWQVKYSDQEWIIYEDIEKELYIRTISISARRECDGIIIFTESASAMGNELKLDPKAIKKAALTRGHYLYHGYRFRLGLSDDSWPTNP